MPVYTFNSSVHVIAFSLSLCISYDEKFSFYLVFNFTEIIKVLDFALNKILNY